MVFTISVGDSCVAVSVCSYRSPPRPAPQSSSENPHTDVDTKRFFEDVSCGPTVTEGVGGSVYWLRPSTGRASGGCGGDQTNSEDCSSLLRRLSRLRLEGEGPGSRKGREHWVNASSSRSPVCLPAVLCAWSSTWIDSQHCSCSALPATRLQV